MDIVNMNMNMNMNMTYPYVALCVYIQQHVNISAHISATEQPRRAGSRELCPSAPSSAPRVQNARVHSSVKSKREVEMTPMRQPKT